MNNILLTGYPGSGKTTVITRLLALAGFDAGGFYTEEIRKGNKRTGFKILTLDGEEAILAEVGFRSKYQVGKYGVNVEGVERVAAKAIERALGSKNLIVIDEIGKMECYSREFREVVTAGLDAPKSVVATIAKRGDKFIESIKGRADVAIYEVTPATRDKLPEKLASVLSE
ncbi:MAG: NTPase [Candidatus Coatesbacteria bacterium]|nr:MAG: NTPase [Candidatus Coatesbacteria bacterium]